MAVKAQKMKRVVKDKETRTEEIRKAAKKLFLKKGYQNTSVEEVAKKAKISKGQLYQYFKNKDDLYYALMFPMLKKLGMLLADLENVLDEGLIHSNKVFFERLMDLLLELYDYDKDALQIYQIFQLNGLFSNLSQNANFRLNKLGHNNYGTMRRILSKGADVGYLLHVNPIVAADIIWAVFLGVVQIEENKLRYTKKDHIKSTLKEAFSLISKGYKNIKHSEDKSV